MRERRETKPTVALDPEEIRAGSVISWPLAIAALERLGPHHLYAQRLGLLALLQECTRAMAEPSARRDLVTHARTLIDALAHLPWDD